MNQYPQTSFASFITNVPTNPLVGSEFVPLVVANQYTEKVTLANLTAYLFLNSATAIASLPVANTPLAGTELVQLIQNGIAKVTPVSSLTQENFGVVAELNLLNQSANLATRNLFIPSAKGMFKLTLYMVTTAVDAGAGTLQPTVTWRDDNAVQTASLVTTAEGTLDLTTIGHSLQVAQLVFEAVAATAITIALTASGVVGTARYNAYGVLEQFTL